MRRARARAERDAPVVWRDGVHLAGTPIWCDARRAREVCFASRYEAVPAARHGQLVATSETLALFGVGAAGATLSAPCGRPFSLGTLRLELVRAGAGLGSASLAVDIDGMRVVYAGAVGRGEGLGGRGDMRTCDVLVMVADHGDERASFPSLEDAAAWIVLRWRAARAVGGALVVVVPGALDGLELIAALAGETGDALVAQRGLRAAAERARAAGIAVPTLRRASARVAPGDLLMWPARRVAGLERLELPTGSRRVVVGDASADIAARFGADEALAWSMAVDRAGALAFVEASGARSVYLTGRAGESLAVVLDGAGRSARALGPPRQMSLF